MKPLIALYALPEQEEKAIKDGLANIAKIVSSKEPLATETMQPDCSAIVILPSTTVTDDILERLPNLRAIISLSAGLDHVDFDKSRYPSVKVINNPTFSVPSVSEYVVSCIFKAHYEAYWANPTAMHEEIAGKKALVIGYGNIGKAVAQKLQALGLEVQVVTSAPVKDVRRCDNLMKGLAWADIVSINTSLRSDTNAMINASCFEVMKPSAILINAARGHIIQNAALLDAADKLRRVFLDDIAEPESVDTQAIAADPRVTYTRHTAWKTELSVQRRVTYTLEQIKSLVQEP